MPPPKLPPFREGPDKAALAARGLGWWPEVGERVWVFLHMYGVWHQAVVEQVDCVGVSAEGYELWQVELRSYSYAERPGGHVVKKPYPSEDLCPRWRDYTLTSNTTKRLVLHIGNASDSAQNVVRVPVQATNRSDGGW